ncbi:MAG TPA: hypothetical protein VN214_14205 [Pseudomonas sp.]|nr:hypothetical protein [Pseudomonas sp.]
MNTPFTLSLIDPSRSALFDSNKNHCFGSEERSRALLQSTAATQHFLSGSEG